MNLHCYICIHMYVCLSSLTCLHRDDRVKFFCLQVLEHHVRSRHGSSSDDDILALRKLLMAWIQQRHQELGQSEVHVCKRRGWSVFWGCGDEHLGI